jgi:hypothetical protein
MVERMTNKRENNKKPAWTRHSATNLIWNVRITNSHQRGRVYACHKARVPPKIADLLINTELRAYSQMVSETTGAMSTAEGYRSCCITAHDIVLNRSGAVWHLCILRWWLWTELPSRCSVAWYKFSDVSEGPIFVEKSAKQIGGSRFLWKVNKLLSDYRASHSIR